METTYPASSRKWAGLVAFTVEKTMMDLKAALQVGLFYSSLWHDKNQYEPQKLQTAHT